MTLRAEVYMEIIKSHADKRGESKLESKYAPAEVQGRFRSSRYDASLHIYFIYYSHNHFFRYLKCTSGVTFPFVEIRLESRYLIPSLLIHSFRYARVCCRD